MELKRNEYGEIINAAFFNPAIKTMLAQAVKQELIPKSFDSLEWDKKKRASGTAIHHEIYDFARGAVIVCIRHASGSKYGVKTDSKEYYMLTRSKGVVSCRELPKNQVAKICKVAPIGDAIKYFKEVTP